MGCSASKKESTLVHEATEEIREGPFRTKFDAMIDARDAITADLKNDAAVDEDAMMILKAKMMAGK